MLVRPSARGRDVRILTSSRGVVCSAEEANNRKTIYLRDASARDPKGLKVVLSDEAFPRFLRGNYLKALQKDGKDITELSELEDEGSYDGVPEYEPKEVTLHRPEGTVKEVFEHPDQFDKWLAIAGGPIYSSKRRVMTWWKLENGGEYWVDGALSAQVKTLQGESRNHATALERKATEYVAAHLSRLGYEVYRVEFSVSIELKGQKCECDGLIYCEAEDGTSWRVVVEAKSVAEGSDVPELVRKMGIVKRRDNQCATVGVLYSPMMGASEIDLANIAAEVPKVEHLVDESIVLISDIGSDVGSHTMWMRKHIKQQRFWATPAKAVGSSIFAQIAAWIGL